MDTYELLLKDGKRSTFRVQRKGGVVTDEAILMAGDIELVKWKAGSLKLQGSASFTFRDKPLTVRWQWSEVTGKPKAIQVFQEDRMVATYPADAEPIMPRKRWYYAAAGFTLASFMSIGFYIALREQLNLDNNLGLAFLVFAVCAVLFTGVGAAVDLVFRNRSR